jgi:hypothetical protein
MKLTDSQEQEIHQHAHARLGVIGDDFDDYEFYQGAFVGLMVAGITPPTHWQVLLVGGLSPLPNDPRQRKLEDRIRKIREELAKRDMTEEDMDEVCDHIEDEAMARVRWSERYTIVRIYRDLIGDAMNRGKRLYHAIMEFELA